MFLLNGYNLPSNFNDPYDSALMFNTKKSLEHNLLNEEGFISDESLRKLEEIKDIEKYL